MRVKTEFPKSQNFWWKLHPKIQGSDFFSVPKHVTLHQNKYLYLLQIWYIAPKHVKNDQNI